MASLGDALSTPYAGAWPSPTPPEPQRSPLQSAALDALIKPILGAAATRDIAAPQTPLDVGMTAAGLPGLGKFGKLASMLGGMLLQPSEAEAGPATKIVKYGAALPRLLSDAFHGFSAIRTGKPIEEYSSKIVGMPQINRPLIDPQSLVGKEAIFLPADRSGAGGTLTHVGDTKLTVPQPQEGGPDYSYLHAGSPLPGGATRQWANAAPVSSGLVNLGNQIIDRGREPVLMTMALGKRAVDSSRQMVNPALDLAKQQTMTRAGATSLNEQMAGVQRNNNFPGWRSPYLQEWLDDPATSGSVRSALMKMLDTSAMYKAGAPDLGELRHAITDPRLLETPAGSAGLTVAPFDPSLGVIPDSLHSTYPTSVAAQGSAGTLGGSIPWHVAAPDIHDAMMKLGNPVKFAERPDYYMAGRVPAGVPRTQVITPEVADGMSQWIKDNPGLWGGAAVAPLGIGAALGSTVTSPPQDQGT